MTHASPSILGHPPVSDPASTTASLQRLPYIPTRRLDGSIQALAQVPPNSVRNGAEAAPLAAFLEDYLPQHLVTPRMQKLVEDVRTLATLKPDVQFLDWKEANRNAIYGYQDAFAEACAVLRRPEVRTYFGVNADGNAIDGGDVHTTSEEGVAAALPPFPPMRPIFHGGCAFPVQPPPTTPRHALQTAPLSAIVNAFLPRGAFTPAIVQYWSDFQERLQLELRPEPDRTSELDARILAIYPGAYRDACAFLSRDDVQRAFTARIKHELGDTWRRLESLGAANDPVAVAPEVERDAARRDDTHEAGRDDALDSSPTDPSCSGYAHLQAHPAALLLPAMSSTEYAELRKDLRVRGLLIPIMMYEGKVLDGRNRLRGCLDEGITPRFEEYAGDDPIGYVLSMNVRRRHLDPSQLAMVAAKAKALYAAQAAAAQEASRAKPGEKANARATVPGRQPSQKHQGTANARAAAAAGSSEKSVERASTVLSKGAPEVVAAVEAAILPVKSAAILVKESAEVQRQVVAEVKAGKKPSAALATIKKQVPSFDKAGDDVPYATSQQSRIVAQNRDIRKLHDELQAAISEWRERDPVGMQSQIVSRKKLLDALAEALGDARTAATSQRSAPRRKPTMRTTSKKREVSPRPSGRAGKNKRPLSARS
jgi:hypothetical protein